MKYFSYDVIEQAVQHILDGKTWGNLDPKEFTVKQRLIDLINHISEECWTNGKQTVQCEIIKVLDLRHYLG